MDETMTPKVLVGVATSKHKAYCEDDFLEQITHFDYPGYDVLIVDNTREDRSLEWNKKLQRIFAPRVNVDVERGAWCTDLRALVGTSYNKIRDRFLLEGYDYLLIIESDIFVKDKSFLKKWVALEKPVIAGIYRLYFILSKLSENQRNLLPSDEHGKYVLSNWYARGNFENGQLFPRYWEPARLTTGLVELDWTTGGFSTGLVLFHRDVLQRIAFKYGSGTPDSFVKQDCDWREIDTFCDTDLEIDHRAIDWQNLKEGIAKEADTLKYGKEPFQKIWEDDHEKEKKLLRREIEQATADQP